MMKRWAVVVSLLAVCVVPHRGTAQAAGWRSVVEANASTIFGATSQTLTGLTAAVGHSGDGFNADASIKFRYGESTDADRVKFVNSRSWAATLSIDAVPKGRFSPFFFGSTEASLEKRIANRSSGGGGAKLVLVKAGSGTASVSAALLGERTEALSDTAVAATSLVRWSFRAKFEQRVAERVSVTHTTFYAPVYNATAKYTVISTSVGSYALNKAIALTLTFTDNYDSQARARGAPTNNDGSLLFGIRAAF